MNPKAPSLILEQFLTMAAAPAATATRLLKIIAERPQTGEDIAAVLSEVALLTPDRDREICEILYPGLIEPLCDDFSSRSADAADMLLVGIIKTLQTHRAESRLDRHLERLTGDKADFFAIRKNSRVTSLEGRNPERLLFLSRISAGADVMITSVLMARLKNAFPEAEIHLAAQEELAAIFSAPHIIFHPIRVNRHGGLEERLSFWPGLIDLGAELLSPGDLIIDPESRLTQLGLLPLAPDGMTLLFPSRSFGENDENANLAELANRCLDESGCPGGHEPPRIHISRERWEVAKRTCQRIRETNGGRTLLINLGVGGNERKRLGLSAEIAVIRGILEQREVTILLDSGRGMEEKSRVEAIITACGGKDDRIFTVDLDLGEVAAHIAAADGFLGYDSSCQHIAAAVGTPGLTMFKGHAHRRFLKRWSPPAASSRILALDTEPGPGETEKIVATTLSLLDRPLKTDLDRHRITS